MDAAWPAVNRWLVWFHRWAGVALCLLVVAWFASGAILHFVPYPSLPRSDQLANAVTIELSAVRIDPAAALARLPPVTALRLVSVAGRPTWVGLTESNRLVAVSADTGEALAPLTAVTARRVAEQFTGARALRVAGPFDYDQWIVHQRFDRYRPLFRVRLDDAQATDLYVSAASGEVVQRTRLDERAWNWPGAVLHWIYFTPLRKSWSAWDRTIWWLSLSALLSSSVGIWLGVVRLISNRAAGRPGLSPFRGWMRWHHVIGLFASVVVLGWIFSGWLSMDHGRLFSRGWPTSEQLERVRGMPLVSVAAAATLASVQDAGAAKEVSLHALLGRPFLVVSGASPSRSRVVWLGGAAPSGDSLPPELLLLALKAAWADASLPGETAGDSERLYRLAESLPPDARAYVAGGGATRIYVDPLSGEILTVMDPSRRRYAWIYYALHTLNFPGLVSRPLLRTSVELTLLAVGLAFGVTGVVLAVRRLRQELAH